MWSLATTYDVEENMRRYIMIIPPDYSLDEIKISGGWSKQEGI